MTTSTGTFVVSSLPTLLPLDDRPTVGIVVTRTGQWGWTADALGYRIAWFWAADSGGIPEWLRVAFPDSKFTSNRFLLTPVSLILCEHKPPGWLRTWDLTDTIVSLRSPSFETSWSKRSRINHAAIGGLTTKSTTLHISRRVAPPFWALPPLPPALKNAVYSVASDTVNFGYPCQGPGQSTLTQMKPKCLGKGVYHGGALYPLDHPRPRFLLRSVFSPTGWCRRPLTDAETLTVLDVPHRIISTGMPGNTFALLSPGRCLQLGLRQLLESICILSPGGDFLSHAKAKVHSATADVSGYASDSTSDSIREELDGAVDRTWTEHVRPGDVEEVLAITKENLKKKRKRCKLEDNDGGKLVSAENNPVEDDSHSLAESEEDEEDEVDIKAVKSDDAGVEVRRWRH